VFAGELNGYPSPLHVLELADSGSSVPTRPTVPITSTGDEVRGDRGRRKLIAAARALDRPFAPENMAPGTVT
jgi:hypothetical protein